MAHADALLQLQQRLAYTFKSPELLALALTHRTWIEEKYPGGRAPAHESQQRLEFLGDALLGYVVGRWLYHHLPQASEGDLTARRMGFTKGAWLSARGAELGLEPLVRRGRGEAANAAGIRKVLEDTTEALIGAILLDGGDAAAVSVIQSWLPDEVPLPVRDPITAFNEWHQATFKRPSPEPLYYLANPDDDTTWCAAHDIDGVEVEGRGRTKQVAKRDLCEKLLVALRT